MDDLLSSLSNMTSHCEEEEYDHLLSMISRLKDADEMDYTQELAKKVYDTNRRYANNISFNVDDYRRYTVATGAFITDGNYSFIENIKDMMDIYFSLVGEYPYDYKVQITYSFEIYEKIKNGIDSGMVLARKKTLNI